jgi:hypothetical protein
MVCHSRAAEYVLGLTTVQMNRDHVHGGVPVNQLSLLAELGLAPIQSVEELRARRQQALEDGTADDDRASRSETDDKPELDQGHMFSGRLLTRPFLVDPYSDDSSLELRVRSYLHANCAQCHVSAGGGNSQIELNFSTPIAKAKLLGVKPVHDTFGLPDARLVVPAHPERSVLLKRLKMRGRGQMPQLATTLPDTRAVSLFREWIQGLGAVEAEGSK